ncbi:MAG TPA: aspartate aminotransferase family protein, partial [Myxococcota bacterium]|nr:aspartate aminotransferase family protein [Myxococcota bacterium]
GLATLRLLDAGAYAQLDRTTATLANGLEQAARDAGVAASVASATGLVTLFFAPEPPRNYEEAKACDLEAHAAFCRGMLDRGIYPPPSQFEAWFPSLAHTDAHVERTVSAAREALGEL